ncbi:MAG: hypothetical protein HN919_13620 [Verrucomicrobia bacterium]|jgi:uncharacterized membrane protein|nr:hypothetical protein [Verrucomicrobiota bacterium]MBT7067339.1 hypothetical protein [Verrucomicrobiota bacterium]MBT7699524.1 hypothetical protein [Verrucomicrobiota bacterium]
METKEVKFGEWMSQSFDLFKENIGPLILISLVALILSTISMGILAGPMMAGLALVTLQLVDKQGKPDVSKLFEGFGFFLQSFLFVLVWGVIVAIVAVVVNLVTCGLASPLIAVGSMALGAVLMFAPYLIVEKKMDFWPASMESLQMVKANFWPLVGYYLVASIIGSAGSVACGVGMIVTMPISWCMYAVAYRELTSAGATPVEALPVPEPPPPPAPTPDPAPVIDVESAPDVEEEVKPEQG